MKITKPSELREGMKIKYQVHGLGYWGWAYQCDDGDWQIIGGTGTGYALSYPTLDCFRSPVTDVESYEGIRAAKEGDVLMDSDGGLAKVVFCNEYIFGRRYAGSDDIHFNTYDTAKRCGWKLKEQEQSSADTITLEGKTYKRDDVLERIKELEPID